MTGRSSRAWRSSWIVCATFLALACALASGSPARAADVKTWRHCMQLVKPALSSTACSQIIDSGQETPENLSYAYLYRARADAYCFRKDQAASDFRDALKRDPTLVHAWYGLGELAMAAEDYSNAVEAFTKAIEANGEDADVDRYASDSPGLFRYEPLRARGYARYKQDDLAQALTDYNAAIKACPTCSEPFRDRGIVLARQHKIDEAFADFNHAIALNPRAPQGFFIRGFVRARGQNFADAAANFSEAIRVSPHARAALRARADAYAKLGKTMEAEADRKQADAVDADLKDDRRESCGKGDQDSSETESEGEGETDSSVAAPTAAGTLDDAALTSLVSAKKWRAKQGLWSVDLEFRRDGTFRQSSRDDTLGGKLQVTTDGAWFAAQGKLCLYTNAIVCMSARKANGMVTLARADGTVEFVGPEAAFQTINLDNATAPIAEYPLDEQFWGGPAGAAKGPKTLLYYIHGLPLSPRMHNPFEPYFVAQIRTSLSWDVIDADFPLKLNGQYMVRGTASTFAASVHVARRIKELKAKGYQRIFVGGQLMGGWVALALSTQAGLPLDGVVMIAPTCCSARTVYETGAPSPDFLNNKLYFEQMIARDRYPTAAVFFLDDEYDPGGRGEAAGNALTQSKVASLVIDRPEGFSGEGSMSLPAFDYLYRDCIVAFLSAPETKPCAPPDLSNSDFRTIFSSSQLPDFEARRIDPATLIGKVFDTYPSGETLKISSAGSTVLKGEEAGERNVASSFRDGQYCLTQKVRFQRAEETDEKCYLMLKWSDREVLALDPESKQVLQWWVEEGL